MRFSNCIGLGIATIVTAIIAVCAPSTAQNTVAQNAGDIINLFGGIVQSTIAQATQSEWRKLSENEIACVDQTLHQRGSSLQALIRQGITPFDARVADVRSTCRNQFAPQPSQAMRTDAQTSKYGVDGLALGGRVQFDSAAYREYECAPSDQFAGFTWCHKKRVEKEARGQFTSSYSILHSADGTAFYISRSLEPAFFTGNEASEEIERLSRKHGAPPRIIPMPQNSGVPYGMIASWGNVVLEPLDTSSVNQLAAGRNVRRGFLIDHIGNFQRSAQLGLPIYRLSGGAGYVYAAHYDQSGGGTLRFLTIDASAISSSSQIAQQPNSTPILDAQPSQAPNAAPQSRKQGEFARLTEIPASCIAARQLGPLTSGVDQMAGREAQKPACQVIWDCRKDLVLQARGALNYLKEHPPIANALRDLGFKRDGGPDSLFKDMADQLNNSSRYVGFVCHYAQSQIDATWVSLNPNSGQKRTFDVFAAASQTLLNKIRSDFKTEDAEYSDLSAFNDRYAGVERFDRAQVEYRQAFEEDDVSRMVQASSAILADLNKARARQQLLAQQSLQITHDQETLSDLSSAFDHEELSRFGSHNPAMFTELSTDLQREAQDAPAKRGDITSQLQILETRLHGVEDAVLGARSNKAKAEQTRLMIAQRENAAEEFINAASREDLKGAFVNEQFVQSANEVKNRLSTLRSTELWLIGDKKGEIQAAMQQLEPLAQRMAAAQFSVDFNKLQERINTRGKNLLDNPSSSQFKELSDFLTSLKQEKFPLTTEARKAFAQNQSFLNSLSATIDGVMDQEEKRQALARQMAALSPEARTFIERHPEYQAGRNPSDAIGILSLLYGADISLEYCTEQAWFSEHRKPLAEVRRRENLIEAALGIQGVEASKIATLKTAMAANKDQIRYAIKYEDGGPLKACDSLVVSLSLSQPW
jgi:hypothetical protein